MKPTIEKSRFGSITIDGIRYSHDVLIRPDGQVKKRKKKLSKAIYGTSHTISLDEAYHIHRQAASLLIIGSGKFDRVRLSPEADSYLKRNGCEVKILPTTKAVRAWNEIKEPAIGLFHITC